MVHGFDRITAAAEIWDVKEADSKPLRHLPAGDLIISRPDRDRAPKKERIFRNRGTTPQPFLHERGLSSLGSYLRPEFSPEWEGGQIPSVCHSQNRSLPGACRKRREDRAASSSMEEGVPL